MQLKEKDKIRKVQQ